MSETVFVQFYNKFERQKNIVLCNGFSDTYDFCSNIGDMVWIECNKGSYYNDDCPIESGIMYASVSYLFQLKRICKWALKTPNVKFIVGGPVNTVPWKLKLKIPNLTLTQKSVEDWFGIKNFSYPWKLKIPDIVKDDDAIQFAYTLDNVCHWNKCRYCIWSCEKEKLPKQRIRKNINFDFNNVKHNGQMDVRLGTDSFRPTLIKKFIDNTTKKSNIRYYKTFIRAGRYEKDVLLQYDDLSGFFFNVGIEYPSENMWNYMKKGYNSKDVLELFNHFQKSGALLHIGLILGWPMLNNKDIKELEQFMKNLKCSSVRIHRLMIYDDTDIDKDYFKPWFTIEGKYFYFCYFPYLNKTQMNINKDAHDIIKYYCEKNNIGCQSKCDFNGDGTNYIP